jgi:hypothetical protein
MCDSFDSPWRSLSAEMSLQRSAVQDLNVIMDGDPQSFDRMQALQDIEKHLARTRTLNIRSRAFAGLYDTFNLVMAHCVPEHISQLSLCFVSPDDNIHQEIFMSEALNDQNSEFHNQATRALSSLTSFRITEVYFDWKFVTFSTRLFELRLNTIMLTGSSEVTGFMDALSSASELRELMLIKVLAFADQGPILPRGRPVILPHLNSLYLEDLYCNFVTLILTSITSTSYRLTLFPSSLVARNLLRHLETSKASTKDLFQVLAGIPVHELKISDDIIDFWTTRDGLRGLLGSMPTLKVLTIQYLDLSNGLLQGLCPPRSSQCIPFPKFHTIEFHGCYISNNAGGLGLKTVVNSHPLEKMVLGLTCDPSMHVISQTTAKSQKRRELIRWLQLKVPFFQFIDDDQSSTTTAEWNLWEL